MSNENGGVSDWLEQVKDAQSTTDRAEQATKWQALNKTAVDNVWIIPTFFGIAQNMAGTKVGNLYRWPAYGSWPYGELYVSGAAS